MAALADAVDRRDVQAAVACLSADVLVDVPGWGGPWRGRDGVAAGLAELFGACEQTRCVIRESQVGTGRVNDRVIVAAKSSQAATPEWMVATATSAAEVTGGLVTRLTVTVDTDALRRQWAGTALASTSLRSEVALAGFDPDAQVVTSVRAFEPVTHGARPTPSTRRWVWVGLAAAVLIGAGAAAWAISSRPPSASPTAVAAAVSSPTVEPPATTPTPTPTPTPTALLGPSAVPVSGGGVAARLSGTVLFDRDSAVLKPDARALVVGLARTLASTHGGSLTVLGYTDNLGTVSQGLTLSQARADAVAAVFVQELAGTGIRITAVGRGEANPVAPNTSEANRAKNRRVEIVYRPS